MKSAIACACVVAALAGRAAAQVPPDAGAPPPDAAAPLIVDGPDLMGLARPQVSASVAPSKVRLGDTLTLFIDVIYDEHVTVSLPSTLDLGDAFDEVKRVSPKDVVRSDGTRKRTWQIQLRAWELGDLRLPPFPVRYSAGGQSSWVVTNTVPIEVVGTLGDVDDKTALMDDTPPVSLKRRDWRLPMIAGGVVIVLAIALIAWRIRKRKRRPLQPVMVMAPVMRPRRRLSGPAERALAELEALDRSGALVAEPRDGYDELVAILRRFAGEQFGVAILDRTTDELLASLAKTGFPPDVLPGARTWFARCDLVKYAAERPAADRSHLDLEDARGLVIASVGGVIHVEEAADA